MELGTTRINLEAPSESYGAMIENVERGADFVKAPMLDEAKSRVLSLKDDWLQKQPVVRVETYGAFSRQKGLVSHGFAKTGLSEFMPDSSELYEVLLRALGEADQNDPVAKGRETVCAQLLAKLAPDDVQRRVAQCTMWSFAVNLVLMVAKLWSSYASGSLAVLASLVDSLLDLAQTGILYVVERRASLPPDAEFPAGRSRLEPVGVLVCAQLMAVGSLGIVIRSIRTLLEAAEGRIPALDLSAATVACLVVTVTSKAVLWAVCASVASSSSSALALAEDHANDVASNTAAIVACGLAACSPRLWWCDSVGALLISIYICRAWYLIARDHVKQIVGKGASEDQIKQLAALAATHNPNVLALVAIRAYHFGPNFIVELTMRAHDRNVPMATACHLQQTLAAEIETLDWVERCFCSIEAP